MSRDKAASEIADSEFIMKPKIDVAFKMLFGEESHRSLLSSLLSAIMGMPRSTFANLEYLNLELSRFHMNDKLGVLDVRVRMENKDIAGIGTESAVLVSHESDEVTLTDWARFLRAENRRP
jgi:hypothetical protein